MFPSVYQSQRNYSISVSVQFYLSSVSKQQITQSTLLQSKDVTILEKEIIIIRQFPISKHGKVGEEQLQQNWDRGQAAV